MTVPVLRLLAVAVAVVFLAVACGSEDTGGVVGDGTTTTAGDTTTTGAGAPVTEATIVAENIAFDPTELTVPAGEQITITVDNRDDGVSHNLHIFSPEDPATEIEEGPVTQTLTATVDEPGEYRFQCDVHPGQMTGTLTVAG